MTTYPPLPDSPALTGVSVSDAMRPGVITCPRDATLPTIAAILITHGIHAVVVSPLERGPPLVVTDFELVRAALERGGEATAGDLAREPIAMLPADATLAEAVKLMAVRYVTHLLVTHPSSGAPAGIVSSLDVAAVVGGRQPRLARVLPPPRAAVTKRRHTLSEATVGDVMHAGVVTCGPDAPLSTLARVMSDHCVHCVAVAGIDSTSRLGQHFSWGLIEDIDLMVALHRDPPVVPTGTIAAGTPLAVQETEALDRAATLMLEHVTRHVVAVGRTGLPSGMVSTLDVARILAESR